MKDKDRPNRKDVAALAGVSETIVSYVLNNNRYVKKDKKDKVLQAVKDLNYQPNRFARALKGKPIKHIILLIDRIRSEAFGELISEIEHFSNCLGYLVSLLQISNSEEFVNKIIDWHVDGIIISSINFDSTYIQKLVDADIPVIILENRFYDVHGTININTGLYEGTRKSVKYMYDTGCRKIVYVDRISEHGHFSSKADYRYSGYIDEILDLGLTIEIISGCKTPNDLMSSIMDKMKSYCFDAAFCRNDEIALIVMNTLIRNGYKIPEDVSIIGLDDTTYSKVSYPTLSSLKIQRECIARTAVQYIEDFGKKQEVPKKIIFEPTLILRESVRAK